MSGPLDVDDLCKQLAKTELGENPATKVQMIEAIRKWIITTDYLECRTDDEFILRFLRVSKFSTEAAKERIEKYCVGRTSELDGMPEWFCDQDLHNNEYRTILEKGLIYPLSEPDADGRLIIFTNYGAGAEFEPMKCGRAAFMMMDYIIAKYPRVQINGIRLMENAAGYNKEQMKYWNLDRVPKAVNMWQGAYPIRLKKIDWYNIPVFARVVMEAAMFIMKAKIRERVTIHPKYEPASGVPDHITPPVMGGKGPEFEKFRDQLLDDLFSYEKEFRMNKDCKVIESKRPKKVYEGDSWGISGTYIQKTND